MREIAALWLAVGAIVASQGSDRLWLDRTGRVSADGREALAVLARAAEDGLDPECYRTSVLQASAARIAAGTAQPGEPAVFDAMLEGSMLRYLFDLHAGRVDPNAVGFRMARHPVEDFSGRLRDAAAAHRVRSVAQELAPPLVVYRDLRIALAKYRALASDRSLAVRDLPARSIHAGDRAPQLIAVRRLLTALGDLTPPVVPDANPDTHDPALVGAIKRFQARHGLAADGTIGRGTRVALQTPLAWRVRQIELAMERLRWLPDRHGERLIAVNIPMFRLWGAADGAPPFTSDVIVGRALNTRTPVFVDRLEHVIFRPYWNVPDSIFRNEILPALRRDPDYLRRNDMEFVRNGNGVRQRPGPSNSLGLVKFVFPNDHNVYMHGTPAASLFERPRRDFSHGCIRVADPVGLAQWVLAGDGNWTREAVVAAMNGRTTLTVVLQKPIPVVLFYVTVSVEQDGTLRFADDIYGHDMRLHRALETLCPPDST